MTPDQVIAKIKKCLALAKSANETEAATALRQAQALMREHGVDEQGVALACVLECEALAKFAPILRWEACLATDIADAFGCEVISVSSPTYTKDFSVRQLRHWRFIGIGAAPEIAVYTFDVLAGQCVRARLAHIRRQSKNCKPITKAARGDAFAVGWVTGVTSLIERFANGERNDALIDAYKRKHYPNLANAKVKARDEGRNVKNDSAIGRASAANAHLNHGVGSPLERKLIGAS